MNKTGIPTTTTKKLLLLPVLPVIFFFLHNLNQFKELIFKPAILLLLFIYSAFAIFIYLLIKKLFKPGLRQSIFLSTIITTCFLFFGAFQDFLSRVTNNSFLSNSFVLLAIFFIAIGLTLILLKRKKPSLIKPVRYLTLAFFTLIAIEIISLGMNIYNGQTIHSITLRMRSGVLDDKITGGGEKPDIYHIIFDSYANAATLKEYWGFQNDITAFLNSKGFYTIDSGFSNYTSTPYSISSIFNLQYLEGAEPYLLSNSPNFYIGQRVYKSNALFKFLAKNHYKFSVFSQLEDQKLMLGLGFLGVKPPQSWVRNETMERVYLNPWLMGKIKRLFGKEDDQPGLVLKSMRGFHDHNVLALNHILSDCQNAQRLDPGAAPIFSFTHIMIPHDPYLLDENGNFVKSPEPGGFNMDRYLGQLKYANKLIKQITECLLADTVRKKIIIFQGDHGFRHYPAATNEAPFGALNAIYFYNKNYSGFTKNFSHVNTYRVIINKFFGGQLPLLKDSIFTMKYD